MTSVPRERLYRLVLAALVLVLSIGLISGGALLAFRRISGGTAQSATIRLNTDAIAPALALRTLAGEADSVILDQALDENQLETALATLLFSTSLNDKERVNYYIVLGQKLAQAKQKERARFCLAQATSILLLSSEAFDANKANAHLLVAKEFMQLGNRADAERNLDFAYTIARYSPYVEDAQRRFVLSNVASEYKALGLERKSDESTRALSNLPPSVPAPLSPAQVDLPAPALGDDVRAATAWRMRAAQRLINSLGGKNSAAVDEARRNLADALRAEDELRSFTYENRLAQAGSTEAKAALAKANVEWSVIRSRIAQKGFGLSLYSDWERNVKPVQASVRQAVANYYLLRREMAAGLPDAVDAAQARLDLLREEMMLGKVGLYPDYPENRLIAELAQATKERIDLREDGLYVAVLSQEGRGLLVITTADLWGRPAAMASAGLGMSFSTQRPSAFVYVPSPTPTRPPTQVVSTPTRQATATPVLVATATRPPIEPTQPTSAVPTPTSIPTQIPPTPRPTFTPPPGQPTPAPPPTAPAVAAPPTATPTPAYNYQVIYKAGPTLRNDTGFDNFHIVGMVVDQNGILISGLQQRISWCCPPGEAIHPRPTIDADNGRFDFFVSRGQFTLDIIDGSATTEPIVVNTDVPGLTGYVEWEFTIQRTGRSSPAFQTRTPTATATATATATPRPPTPTPPLPGAVSARLTLDPGWNFIALPLAPATTYSAESLRADMNTQLFVQGGGVGQVASWDGARISPYSGNISLGVGYFVNITGTNRVYWTMIGYPLAAPVPLSLNQTQKVSIAIPYMTGGVKSAAQLADELNTVGGAGTFVRLWRLKDTLGNWEYYDGTATGIASFNLAPDRGYLLEVSRSFTWAPWQPATPTFTPTPTWTPSVTPTPTSTPFDTYEPNNNFDQAWPIQPDTPSISYIAGPTDVDYYKFQLAAPATVYPSLTNLPEDYDLYLYNPSRFEIDASFNGGQTSEYITRTVTTIGWHYVLVKPAGPVYDTIKPYKLLLSLGPP